MFVQNQILNNTYQILDAIGSGGTSSVYLAYHLNLRKYVVVKELARKWMEEDRLRTEVDILKNLHHPNLPQVYDFVWEKDAVYTVIDYVEGYDLEAYIKAGTKFTQEQVKYYLRQIADALQYLHSLPQPVIHSDIKPGNIIITPNGSAVLIDFNISIGGNWGSMIGMTPAYASPEQIEMAHQTMYQGVSSVVLDGRSDIYSLGATIYELISGIRPTAGVPQVPLSNLGLTQYSKELLGLIDRMMIYDRNKRVRSAQKVVATLERMDTHYWIYFVLRCTSVLLSASLISMGIYCFIRGNRQNTLERYQHGISIVSESIAAGNMDVALAQCQNMMAEKALGAYIYDNASVYAQYCHTMGDIYYYKNDYVNAAAYYDSSVAYCDSEDMAQLANYLCDSAIAYAQNGNLTTAESRLAVASSYGIESNELLLVEAVLCARKGEVDRCIDAVNRLISGCEDRELCSRAAQCAASALTDVDAQIHWLQTALSYDNSRITKRLLAFTYARKGQSAADETQRTAALSHSELLYSELNESEYASLEDRINYSVVLRMCNRTFEAVSILEKEMEQYPGHYRLLTNLAFAHNELGDTTNAMFYCQMAVEAWKEDSSPDKLSEGSEEIQNLLELCRRYEIGGIR